MTRPVPVTAFLGELTANLRRWALERTADCILDRAENGVEDGAVVVIVGFIADPVHGHVLSAFQDETAEKATVIAMRVHGREAVENAVIVVDDSIVVELVANGGDADELRSAPRLERNDGRTVVFFTMPPKFAAAAERWVEENPAPRPEIRIT